MYGYWYSVKENFKFERKEFYQYLWTSLAYGFVLSFRKWGVDKFDFQSGISNFIQSAIVVLLCLFIHISAQKLVAIKLGYKASYSYWLNGILFCMLLTLLTNGYSGVIGFILIGAVTMEHIPRLRLGKFRYGTNLKDVARVSLAGPIANVITVLVLGTIFFSIGRDDLLFAIIVVNLFLAFYSMLPIPKIDIPTRVDSGSNGLGVFWFSRTLYVLTLATILIFAILVFISVAQNVWGLFAVAFVIGSMLSIIYSIALEQKN